MPLNLAGKTALITGSSKGIGFAIARALHSKGCKVSLNARDEKNLNEASRQLKGSVVVPGDVSKIDDAIRVVNESTQKLGGLDILICSVGTGKSVAPGLENAEEWRRVFELNFWSAVNVIESARGILRRSKGVIICISSICGLEVIPDAPVTYSTAKAALNAYIRGIARPLGREGIRINAIAPGNIIFPGSGWEEKLGNDSAGVMSKIQKEVSLQRFGKLEDVSNIALWLSSPTAGFVSGSIFVVDGGQSRRF